VIIDSGASVNVLDKNTFHRLYNGPKNTIKLSDSRVKLFSYGAVTPLPVLGKFDAMVTIPAVSSETASSTNAQFIVVNTIDSGCLLGKSAAIALGLLRVGLISGTTLNAVTMQSDVEVILSKYPTVFSGVGKLNNYQLKVHVNHDIPPVAQPPRRVPFHIRKVVDKKLR
jgi:hypothetical protein